MNIEHCSIEHEECEWGRECEIEYESKCYDWKIEENSVVDFSYYDIHISEYFSISNMEYIFVCIYGYPNICIYLLMVTGNFCLPHTSNIYFTSAQYLCCSALIFCLRIRFFSRTAFVWIKTQSEAQAPGIESHEKKKTKCFSFFLWNGNGNHWYGSAWEGIENNLFGGFSFLYNKHIYLHQT